MPKQSLAFSLLLILLLVKPTLFPLCSCSLIRRKALPGQVGSEVGTFQLDMMNRRHIPAFGSWDYWDDLPITQCFESAMQTGFCRGQPLSDEDAAVVSVVVDDDDGFFKSPSCGRQRKVQQAPKGGERQNQRMQQRKQGRVFDETAQAAAAVAVARRAGAAGKAVDEDLYAIPPPLLNRKPNRVRSLVPRSVRKLWSGCLAPLYCVG